MSERDPSRTFQRRALLIASAGAVGGVAATTVYFLRQPAGDDGIPRPPDTVGNLMPAPSDECVTLSDQLRVAYVEAREHFDEQAWNALVSRFRGQTAAALVRIGKQLQEIRSRDAGATGSPSNDKRKTRPSTEVSRLRPEDIRILLSLDDEIAKIAGSLGASYEPGCGQRDVGTCNCAPGDPLCSCL